MLRDKITKFGLQKAFLHDSSLLIQFLFFHEFYDNLQLCLSTGIVLVLFLLLHFSLYLLLEEFQSHHLLTSVVEILANEQHYFG